MEDLFDNWTVQVRKGVLELCILAALRDGERYGYELVKRLVAVPGVQVAEGSIYPLLSRLKRQGFVETRLVESAEGPARKYYALTKAGWAQSETMAEYFRGLVGGFETLSKANEKKERR
jgi:PadR family transcriptional regulator PadR